MKFLPELIVLFCTINLSLHAKPLALDKPGQIESVIFVNGKARKANYSVSKTKKALLVARIIRKKLLDSLR